MGFNSAFKGLISEMTKAFLSVPRRYVGDFTFYESYIVMHLGNKNQQNAHILYYCFNLIIVPSTYLELFQIKPTRCTLLLSIFISNSVHVSGNYVPIIRRTYCIYATLVFFTVYGWLSATSLHVSGNCVPIIRRT